MRRDYQRRYAATLACDFDATVVVSNAGAARGAPSAGSDIKGVGDAVVGVVPS